MVHKCMHYYYALLLCRVQLNDGPQIKMAHERRLGHDHMIMRRRGKCSSLIL